MITAEAALEHRHAIAEQDRIFMAKHQAELSVLRKSNRKSGLAANNEIDDNLNFPEPLNPRAGIFLLNRAFMGLYYDTLEQEGQELVDTFLLNLSGIPIPERNRAISATSSSTVGNKCIDAEWYFNNARQHTNRGSLGYQNWVNVYHTDDGKPLVYQKSVEAKTGLTLEPLEVNGIIVPPGFIVGLGNHTKISGKYELVSGRSMNTIAVSDDDPIRVTPLRASAWVYEEEIDRSIFALEKNGAYRGGTMTAICDSNVDDFRKGAHNIMELCGVEQ